MPTTGVPTTGVPTTGANGPDFAAVRAEFELPTGFPPDVLAEAGRVAARPPEPGPDRVDATDLALVTIDPPGSKDLDQAVGVARRDGGFRVHYAIADLGAVVEPGGPLDVEARRRGQTVYLPDGSVPLHPPVLSEGAASLLPDGPRAAVLWTSTWTPRGEPVTVDVRRALVRSRAQLDYPGVQADHHAGRLHPAIAALPEVGRLRRRLAVRRGAIELELPEQEVVRAADGGWTVQVRQRLEVEAWNAEISLLTGMTAGQIMLRRRGRCAAHAARAGADRGRAAPAHRAHAGRRLAGRRHRGRGAGRAPAGHPARAGPAPGGHHAAARRGLRRVRRRGRHRAAGRPGHGGIGAPYAHVTAPLRRLVDRFGTEICLAVSAGREPPGPMRAALPELPELMTASDAVAGKVGRACIDRTEAALLADRVGEHLDVMVLRPTGPEGEPGEVSCRGRRCWPAAPGGCGPARRSGSG